MNIPHLYWILSNAELSKMLEKVHPHSPLIGPSDDHMCKC